MGPGTNQQHHKVVPNWKQVPPLKGYPVIWKKYLAQILVSIILLITQSVTSNFDTQKKIVPSDFEVTFWELCLWDYIADPYVV